MGKNSYQNMSLWENFKDNYIIEKEFLLLSLRNLTCQYFTMIDQLES